MNTIQTWAIRTLAKAKELETSLLELNIILEERNYNPMSDLSNNVKSAVKDLEKLVNEAYD